VVKKPIPFGKYLLLERVNVGGMAEVFKAKTFGVEGFERLIALKRILPSIAEDQEFIVMFIDEAKIAVQLSHANIAQIFDLGKVGESYFIAMEYVQGKDLRAIFDRSRKRGETVPVPMACYITMKVCEGLDYAHNKKDSAGRPLHLVHRDVSPQNVLISYDGEIKLIDFGIAKAANKAGKTQAGILKGKFGYMSPEQVRGLPLDRRSDIFAMGIVLYEQLTGERLFVGESDFSTLEKVRNVEIMPPSTYNRRIPEELEQIVLRALAKDAEDRYQSAMDLHDDLQSFMYTSGNFFARKDLSSYMRRSFQEEIAREVTRDEEYRKIDAASMRGGGLSAFENLPSEQQRRAPPPPPAVPSRTPPPPPPRRSPKSTMLGMGAVSPPPRPSGPAPSGPPPAPPMSAAASAPAAGPQFDMDWDEDELATQIYDKPEFGGYVPPGSPSSPGMSSPGMSSPGMSSPGMSSPGMSSPAAGAPSPFGDPGRQPVGPSASPPMGLPPQGAPSPFGGGPSLDPNPTPSALPARGVREPTEVTSRPSGRKGSSLGAIVAAAAVLLLGLVVGGYFLFRPATPGNIRFTSTPTDPVVLFDEQAVDATASPFVITNVAAGERHLLEVRKRGYRTYSTRVQVVAGDTLDLGQITLEQEAGAAGTSVAGAGTPSPTTGTGIALDSAPSGAQVYVDGRELSERTPLRLTDLTPGQHTIRVEHGERYGNWQGQIDVQAGRIIEMPSVTLRLKQVQVSFSSEPPGADVTLIRGGRRTRIGTTPTTSDVDIEGGAYTVEMEARGYGTYSAPLTIPGGREEYTLEARLEPNRVAVHHPRVSHPVVDHPTMNPTMNPTPTMATASGPGTLRINSRPWSQVYVDGRLIGNTPQMNISLPAGPHRVTLVNPDFNIRENVSVTITAGEVTTKIVTLNPS